MTSAKLPHKPTLADVAKKAGVSTVTVSRMVNRTHKVSEKTQERVNAAMKELGYFGNAAATQLVSGRTKTVGVLTSEVLPYGYASTIEGIDRQARIRGFSVIISVMDLGSEEGIMRTVASVASQPLAGVIAIDFDKYAEPLVQELPSYLPVVTTSGPGRARSEDYPTVFIDDAEGSKELIKYLIELGHATVFIIGQPITDPDEQRTRGVLEALAEAHLPTFTPINAQNWTPQAGYEAMRELLDRHGDLVTAVACGNDDLALGAIRAANECGLTVPDDISIVGFDNSLVAGYSAPPLTTVNQDFEALGRLVFDRLLDLIDDPSKVSLVEKRRSSLVIRSSAAKPSPERGLSLR